MDAIDLLGNIVLALLAISAAAMLEPRLGVAAPLLLIAAGIGVSFLPGGPRDPRRAGLDPRLRAAALVLGVGVDADCALPPRSPSP